VEVDGNLLPPNIINKLNIFMVNVLRFKGGNDLSGLVDTPEGMSGMEAALEDGEAACCAACAEAAVEERAG
jgi:hypothetical protein